MPGAVAARTVLLRRAFVLEWLTLAWMAGEVALGLTAALRAHSLTLLAFGLDTLIEIASAAVVLWRLHVELRQGAAFSETVERRTARVAATLLIVLALYIAVAAAVNVREGRGAEFSTLGLVLAITTVPAMYALARAKRKLAAELESAALRADAAEAVACGALAIVVVVGLAAQAFTHAWWIDAVSSFVLVVFLLNEARESWGEENDSGG